MNQQKSFGNDQFPNTIVEASEILSNHNDENQKLKQTQRQIRNNYGNHKNNVKPENTNEHNIPIPTLSFAQLEVRCHCCGKKGHKSPQCNYKNSIPREEWAITKTRKQFAQASNKCSNDNSTITTKDSTISTHKNSEKQMGWANLHFSFFQSNEMKELVLLDSDSTDTVFCNRNYVTNIRKSDKPLILKTNGGEITTTHICKVPYLGTQWINENAVTNIISLSDIAEKYRVTMDTQNEKAFTVYLPNKTIKFPQMKGGLYARNPYETKSAFQLTSILKNKQEDYITKEKMKRAETA